MATAAVQQKRAGIGYWMQQVLIESERAAAGFSSSSVHDLRTSLRRCRSMADGIMVFDPGPAWKRMKKSGRELFSSLGALRDTQVMQEWVEKLAPKGDPSAATFLETLRTRESELRLAAAASLRQFDRSQWSNWAKELPSRAEHVAPDSPVFAHLALERWHQARGLHCRALRNRTKVSFHDLRIGIKRFRYTVENFLPALHETWGRDLKDIQDLLGDVHDLDVLLHAVLQLNVFRDAQSRSFWRSRIEQERGVRLQEYRRKMTGPGSLWRIWLAAMPDPAKLRTLGFQRLKIWAAFLDPDVSHSKHVAELALQVFDGLRLESDSDSERDIYRYILHLAAITHDVGHSLRNKGHHKASARLVRGITPPLGWTADELQTASLVARYHRGALPRETQKIFSALPQSKQWLVKFLGGILRLACACDHEHDRRIRRVQVENSDPVWTIRAMGYNDATPLAEHIAAARHLLELAFRRPVFVLPFDGVRAA